jgi:nitroreductase
VRSDRLFATYEGIKRARWTGVRVGKGGTVDLYEAIKGRRSVRKFKSYPVSKELLEKIMEMATWAPSGMNLQNWYFVVMTGEKTEGLVRIVSQSYGRVEPVLKEVFAERPAVLNSTRTFFKGLGNAPVIVCAYFEPTRERPETSIQTVAAAIQNLLLAAHAEGLGACWMTAPVHEAERINEALGISGKQLVAVVPMGYPDQSPPAPKRRSNRVVYEGFV